MKKFLSTLFVFIFIISALHSQSVSDTIPPKKDSTIQQDSAPRVIPKKRVRPRVIKDTLLKIQASDSLIKPSVPYAAPRNWIVELKRILSENPYFNFTGQAQVRREVERVPRTNDLMFYILLGLFFYFALIKTVFNKYVNNLLAIFLRITLKQQQLREQLLQSPLPSLLLNILFILTSGFYISLLLDFYQVKGVENFWLQTAYCFLILILIYTGKLIILKCIGWIFNISKAADTYIFIVFLVNKMLGIFLLPFLVLIVFEPIQAKQVIVTLSLIFVALLIFYRLIFSFRPLQNEIRWSLFQFFIYLCAFEVAPLILIYKVLLALVEKSN